MCLLHTQEAAIRFRPVENEESDGSELHAGEAMNYPGRASAGACFAHESKTIKILLSHGSYCPKIDSLGQR